MRRLQDSPNITWGDGGWLPGQPPRWPETWALQPHPLGLRGGERPHDPHWLITALITAGQKSLLKAGKAREGGSFRVWDPRAAWKGPVDAVRPSPSILSPNPVSFLLPCGPDGSATEWKVSVSSVSSAGAGLGWRVGGVTFRQVLEKAQVTAWTSGCRLNGGGG